LDTFTPLADGRPALKGFIALAAQSAGNTLAVSIAKLGAMTSCQLWLFRLPEATALSMDVTASSRFSFALSRNGNFLCLYRRNGRFEIRAVPDTGQPVIRPKRGGFTQDLYIGLGKNFLILQPAAHHCHCIGWERGILEVKYLPPLSGPCNWPAGSIFATSDGVPAFLQYDRSRFQRGTALDLVAVADRYGQVAIFDRRERLICQLFAFRRRLAVWMPDGTCYGPISLTGRHTTVNALEKIGRALRQASQESNR
jgi:hypothetical protein